MASHTNPKFKNIDKLYEKKVYHHEEKQQDVSPQTSPVCDPMNTNKIDFLKKHDQQQAPVMNPLEWRHIKWEYVIPIIFTPAAHVFVSLIRKYPQHKTKMYWGVAISTFLTVQARLILMYDAGYPGAEKVDKEGLHPLLKLLLF